MKLILHSPNSGNQLTTYYRQAFAEASELFIVTAYLTEWDKSLKLNPKCFRFRLIIGKDFGITRKAACVAAMKWLPSQRKSQFLVADLIGGFHPKAVFWKNLDGNCFAIIGSSNLTRAAFETNYEANVIFPITLTEYNAALNWISVIESHSVPVSIDWLNQYRESRRRQNGSNASKANPKSTSLITLTLPLPIGAQRNVTNRRKQLSRHKKHRKGLLNLFKRCAAGSITSDQFYESLSAHWGHENGNRFQGAGWEISGKHSDFQALSISYLNIYNAKDVDRDDIVAQEIDRLRKNGVGTRRALLSEFLCLEYPDKFPVLNKPVFKYLQHIKFRSPRNASEGARYIDLAMKLRFSLLQNKTHPAKNLAELDTVIWLAFGDHD